MFTRSRHICPSCRAGVPPQADKIPPCPACGGWLAFDGPTDFDIGTLRFICVCCDDGYSTCFGAKELQDFGFVITSADAIPLLEIARVSVDLLVATTSDNPALTPLLRRAVAAMDRLRWELTPASERQAAAREREARMRAKEQSTLVYFIQDTGLGNIKIGFTKDLQERLLKLQTSAAHELKVLKSLPGGRKKEYALHKQFEHLRIGGEWFKPEPELLDFISRIP